MTQPTPVDPASPRAPKLMDQMRAALRARHYSPRTERAYCGWVVRYIRFHHYRHPSEMTEPEINAFLTHLAVDEHVSASTQTQALSALLFFYRYVIGYEIGEIHGLVRAKVSRRLPVVLTPDEVTSLLNQLEGDYRLIASVLYGSGLRLMECLELRVQDVDFDRSEITVRRGKGDKDRITMLPQSLKPALRQQPGGRSRRIMQRAHDRGLCATTLAPSPSTDSEEPDQMDAFERQVRATVIQMLRDTGRAPTASAISEMLGLAESRASAALHSLADEHRLVLVSGTDRVRMAHPFSGVDSDFLVAIGERTWFANCVWDGLSILALLGDGTLQTHSPATGESITLSVRDGAVEGDAIVHFLIPARQFWDDIVFT